MDSSKYLVWEQLLFVESELNDTDAISSTDAPIKQKAIMAIRDIWANNPILQKDILNSVQRFYKKSGDALLLTLIDNLSEAKK